MSPSGDGWFGRPILRPAKEPPLPQIQHPAGHPQTVSGKKYFVDDGTYYRAFASDGDTVYMVVEDPHGQA